MACLLLLPPAARAGTYVWNVRNADGDVTSYSPTYSGGAGVVSDGYNAGTYPYACSGLSHWYYTDTITYGGSPDNGVSTPFPYDVTNTCSGQITATFTWQPAPGQTLTTDPPPASAIVEQDSTVYGGMGGTVDFVWATGLGQTGTGENGGSQTAYSVQNNPGASFSVTCSPSMTATIPAGYTGDDGSIVAYKAYASPVTVGLGGTIRDSSGNANILIGQRCQGSLSAGPASLSNYQWTVPGQVFGKFNVATDQSWAYASNLFPDPDWIKASPQWCWSKDEPQTVSCTAQATINGQVIGTVTGQKQVTIWAPDYLFKPMSGPVSVGSISINGTLSYSLYAGGPADGSGYWTPPGTKNGGRVSTPSLFRSTSAGAGTWQFVQLISPGRWKYWYDALGISHTSALNYDGQQLLDNQWPYPFGASPPYPADSVDQSPYPNTPTYWMEDTPSTGLDDYYYRCQNNDSFDDYMMYLPPDSGYGSEWVPLHHYQWSWQADIMRTGTTWPSGWGPMPAGNVTGGPTSARCVTHPTWQYKLTNGNMHY